MYNMHNFLNFSDIAVLSFRTDIKHMKSKLRPDTDIIIQLYGIRTTSKADMLPQIASGAIILL